MSNYSLPFFKPYQGKGHAFIFEYGQNGFFVKSMPENPDKPKSFLSKESLNFSLQQTDLGELLAVLSGRQEGAGKRKEDKDAVTFGGLYHETKTYSAVLNVQENNKGGYSVSLSRKEGGNLTKHFINLTLSEAQLLLEFIRCNLRDFFKSDFEPKQNSTSTPAARSSNKVAAPVSDDTPF